MRLLWIFLAAAQLFIVLHLLVTFAFSKLRKSPIGVVVYGLPTLVRFERAGVLWKLGPLPLYAWAEAKVQRSEIALPSAVWTSDRARSLAAEQQAAPVIFNDLAVLGVSLAAQLAVGLYLVGPARGIAVFLQICQQIFGEAWPPWSRGAAAVGRGFEAVTQASVAVGIGLVLLAGVAAALCSNTFNRIFRSLALPSAVRWICFFVQLTLQISWLVALVCAIKGR